MLFNYIYKCYQIDQMMTRCNDMQFLDDEFLKATISHQTHRALSCQQLSLIQSSIDTLRSNLISIY